MNQPFYFPDGRLANNADELLELCQQYPDEATNYLVREDLEKWLAYIGSYDLAECAVNARQTELEDRHKLEEFLSTSHSLTIEEAVPAAVIETQIEDNLTAPESASTTPDLQEEPVDESTSVATVPMSATVTDTTEVSQKSSPESMSATPPAMTAESVRSANAGDSPTKSSSSGEAGSSEEKPSFFQVIAKFIVKILYRNKA